MAQVLLSNWHGDNKPGDTIEVDDTTAARLVDGGVGSLVEAETGTTTTTSNWSAPSE